jgi:uncharacterized membrane protein YczE
MVRRVAQMLLALTVYGLADGLLIRAGLGVSSWDVLHQGLSRTFGLQVGGWTAIVGVVVLLGWIPLHQRLGIGTLFNVLLISGGVNFVLSNVPPIQGLAWRLTALVGSTALIGLATGAYLGARLGPGPRDGLMTGLVEWSRGGRFLAGSVGRARTAIEVTVVIIGGLLGGNIGVGTVLFAVSIGPLVHVSLPIFSVKTAPARLMLAEPVC